MSISRRNDGRYVVKFKDGTKWKQKTFRAREDAEGFERSTQYDKPRNTRLTVSESILLFLSRTKHAKKGEKAYARTLERIGDEIATKYVDSLGRRDLENVRIILQREWKMTADSINRAVQMLKAAFRWCATEDFIREAPWGKYRDLPAPKKRHLCGDFSDFRKVYALCSPALQWAVRTCLALCLRPGKELANLCWKQIDLNAGKAMIYMYKTDREKTVFCPRWWLEEAEVRYSTARKEDPVCPSPQGKKYYTMAAQWRLKRIRARVKNLPLYTVRHMAASLMLEAGADIAAVAAQLGHKNVSTTGTFYIHVISGAQKRAADDIPALPK